MHVLHELGCCSLLDKRGTSDAKKRLTCLTHGEYYDMDEIGGEEQVVSGQPREKEQPTTGWRATSIWCGHARATASSQGRS